MKINGQPSSFIEQPHNCSVACTRFVAILATIRVNEVQHFADLHPPTDYRIHQKDSRLCHRLRTGAYAIRLGEILYSTFNKSYNFGMRTHTTNQPYFLLAKVAKWSKVLPTSLLTSSL